MAKDNLELVVTAARRIMDAGLAHDDSVFTPGAAIWTASVVDELFVVFVERPDLSPGASFLDKVAGQLVDASDDAKQLFAELLLLNLLPLANYHGATKRNMIEKVLGWATRRVEIPSDLQAALDGGVFNGGSRFNIHRWAMLSFLREWKSLPEGTRTAALADPWTFKALVDAAPGPNEYAQRGALLYLAFPNVVLPVVSVAHKGLISKAFPAQLPEPTGNLDRDVITIKQALESEHGGHVDFYRSPWVQRWHPSRGARLDELPSDEDLTSRRAWLVRGSSVSGHNLVPIWLEQGWASLAAANLRPVSAGMERAEIQAVVEEDYQHKSYAARREKVGEFHTFLNRIQVGDLVVTTSHGEVFLGVVTDDAEWTDSPGSRSNLRRPVEWRNASSPVAFAALPPPLPAKLSSQADVVDLTEQFTLIEGLVADDGQVPLPVPRSVLTLKPVGEALADELLLPEAWLQELADLLAERRQVVLYGPPGTGKTFIAQHLAWHLTERQAVRLVQFHPSYSYEDFFEGYRPVPGSGGTLGFELRPGPFRRIVEAARADPSTPYVLIIDEINRANLAKVFGELYFLLEYRDSTIGLLYSAGDEDDFTLPENVFLIGTMNTSDRSIALVDAAMRRRFAFVSLHPTEEPIRGLLHRWLVRNGHGTDPAELLAELNRRMADHDYAVGGRPTSCETRRRSSAAWNGSGERRSCR